MYNLWHVSRYKLRLLAYAILLLFIQISAFFLTDYLLSVLPHDATGLDDDFRLFQNSYQGPIALINEKLTGDPIQDRLTLAALSKQFGHPLVLVDVNSELSNDVKQQLKTSQIAFDMDDFIFYNQYKGSLQQLIKIGPVVNTQQVDENAHSFYVFLGLYSSISLFFLIVAIFYLFTPLWQDAWRLRSIAHGIMQETWLSQDIQTRTWLFRPLSQALEQTTKRLGVLLNNSKILSFAMAHELKTPLARIQFGLASLEDAQLSSEERQELAMIQQDLRQLDEFINISLDFFKRQQSQIQLNKENIKIKDWLDNLCQSAQISYPAQRNIIQNIHIDSIQSDKQLLSIALQNLLHNACKYGGDTIVITVTTQDAMLIIDVADNGNGIDPQYHEHIFAPFTRLHANNTGFGLGLAYVKLCIEHLGGEVSLTTNQDDGCSFQLRLPI